MPPRNEASKSRREPKGIPAPHSSWNDKPGIKKPQGNPPFRFTAKPPKPTPDRLAALLKTHGVIIPRPIIEKIWSYHQFLRKHNHDLDLTRLIGFETIVQRHYADCLILDKYLKGKWPSPLVDIGTGAGFPGIMIKLIAPHVHIILSEPRPRRVEFLNAAIAHLGLTGIEVFGHKFTSKSFTRPVGGIITRAFETVDKTLPRLMNAVPIGGRALFMKGPKAEEELLNFREGDWRLKRKIEYRIPETTLDRLLLEFERIAATQGAAGIHEEDEIEGTGESEN
jgi:16S rRNA (guanine527-N7)-methyltransferase